MTDYQYNAIAQRGCYVVSYHSNPEESHPIGVYESLADAKTHEPGEWTGDNRCCEWDNGPFSIVYCTFWPASTRTPQ